MRYVVLLVGYPEGVNWETMTEEEQGQWIEQHEAFDKVEKPGCTVVGGEALASGDTATVFQRQGSEVVLTDGPFAEATEAIGGLYILEAPDFDALTEWLAVLPPYIMEIRPIDTSFS